MTYLWTSIQVAIAAIGGVLGWFLGGLDGFLYALIAFIAIDYITGVMCAILEKRLSSDIGFRGIFKKVLILVMVGVGSIIDEYIIGAGGTVRTMVIFFYISSEGVSLLENAAAIGLPIPDKLKGVLSQIRDKDNGYLLLHKQRGGMPCLQG